MVLHNYFSTRKKSRQRYTSPIQSTSMAENFEKSLLGTLRLHSSPITCVIPFYLPSTLRYSPNEEHGTQYPIFTTSVISADESGLIIWWNLATRRPLGIWKAHDETVLTMKQLGLSWNFNASEISGVNIPIVGDNFGQLLTHSKDGSMKIWRLIDLISGANSGFTYSCLLKKKLSTNEELKTITPPIVFEMPINVLNFTNVDITSNGVLITPATIDSEGFDIYIIDTEQNEDYKKLRRLIQNLKFKDIRTSKPEKTEFHEEIEKEVDLTKRDSTGVIMKLKWIDDKLVVVGYENGQVVGYKIGENSDETEIVFNDESLTGNSITSILYDPKSKRIVCASTGSKVLIMGIDGDSIIESRTFNVKHKGINDIDVDFTTDCIGLITWDGYTRVYRYSEEDNVLDFVLKFKRPTPAISSSKEAMDNENGDINQANGLQAQRANVIKFTIKQVDPSNSQEIRDLNLQIVYTNGRCKNIVKKNREESFGERWMFVGYQDGKIAVYSLK